MARLVLIAPGRGSYNRSELAYFQRFQDHPHFQRRLDLLAQADRLRQEFGRPTVSSLDGAPNFRSGLHLPGENASALIFTATAADAALIHPQHETAAVLGNSMGWYGALFTGGALDFQQAFRVVDTMGSFQKNNVQGGQLIYPIVDEDWRIDKEREASALETATAVAARGSESWVAVSIRLGGFLVFAGSEGGLGALMAALPKLTLGSNDYPFKLAFHSAFHTPLMKDASDHGYRVLSEITPSQPKVPMIDGRGHIWRRYQSDPKDLMRYTLVSQVLEPFDFTAAVRVALREYNPDHLVLLGPGETLGGAIAHVMIDEGWRGLHSRADFVNAQQSERPPLIAMNRPDQAARII